MGLFNTTGFSFGDKYYATTRDHFGCLFEDEIGDLLEKNSWDYIDITVK
jgi:hypothetical protein